MRRKKGSAFHPKTGRRSRRLLLALVVLAALGMLYACTAQQLVYSSRGTMIFLPDAPFCVA